MELMISSSFIMPNYLMIILPRSQNTAPISDNIQAPKKSLYNIRGDSTYEKHPSASNSSIYLPDCFGI